MIWLSWRQARSSVVIVAAVVVALAVIFAIYGASLVHLYDTTITGCNARGNCAPAESNLNRQAHWVHVFGALVAVIPALVGIFWGAPLVARELETGTWRLAWTQSATRTRWLWSKLAVFGLASMVVAGVGSLMVTWWAAPVDRVNAIPYWTFDQRDIVPVAYAAFAFMLGVALGTLIRRTLPAMAATLVGFVGLRFIVTEWIRPHLLSPTVARLPFNPFGPPPRTLRALNASVTRGLVLHNDIYTRSGRLIGQNGDIAAGGGGAGFRQVGGVTRFVGVGNCPNRFPPAPHGGTGRLSVDAALQHATQTCVASFHLRQVVTFQPASHYWPLQWMESGLFVALAAALAVATVWWVRRKLA